MSRTIYWGSGSTPAWRVLICLEEKGLPYDSRIVEFSKRASVSGVDTTCQGGCVHVARVAGVSRPPAHVSMLI